MKTWYNSRRWGRDALFPLVAFAVCGRAGRPHHTFSALWSGPRFHQVRGGEGAPRAGTAVIRDSRYFSGGSQCTPLHIAASGPPRPLPRGEQGLPRGKSRCGFPERFPSFVNPYLAGKGKGYKSARSLPRAAAQPNPSPRERWR